MRMVPLMFAQQPELSACELMADVRMVHASLAQ